MVVSVFDISPVFLEGSIVERLDLKPQRDSNISFKQVSVVYLGPYGQNLLVVVQ